MSTLTDAAVLAGRSLDEQRAHEALHGILRCPNCGDLVKGHPDNDCVLQVMLSVIRDRGNKTPEEIEALHAMCDVDTMWDDLAPTINKLEDGEYGH